MIPIVLILEGVQNRFPKDPICHIDVLAGPNFSGHERKDRSSLTMIVMMMTDDDDCIDDVC